MPRPTPFLWLLALCVPSACRAPAPALPDAPTGTWPYWPDSMRFHPLTRITADGVTQSTVIETRIEFVDAERITTRASGEMGLALHDGASGALLSEWVVDLERRPLNAQHFDEVTRTYLFKLKIEPAFLPRALLLRASFHGADGRAFGTSLALQLPE